MGSIEERDLDGTMHWYDRTVFTQMDPNFFDPDWLREKGFHHGHAKGRNSAHFLHFGGHDMVLRHFYRGGLIGRFNKDRYLREPAKSSRAMQEFKLLVWMREQGLPVPRPLAARYAPAGLWYRADLIMERIANSRTLADLLLKTRLESQDWLRIGATVGRMHGIGVDHSDLNCRNILMDTGGQVWLIDFDKCERREAGKWMEENIARLKRSLIKEKGKVPGLHWTDTDWTAFLDGYQTQIRSPA